jgi:hypothetical protein
MKYSEAHVAQMLGRRSRRAFPVPLPCAVALFVLVVYWVSGPSVSTPHDQYIRLALAFLAGRLDLPERPPWLEVARYDGRTYVIQPPFPALLAIPYVLLAGPHASQTAMSQVLGALNAAVVFLIVRRLTADLTTQLWLVGLFAFGTIYWYVASVGSVWYLAHVVAVLMLNLAILETLGRRRPLLIGLALGAAYWTRLPTILSLPFFLTLAPSERNLRVGYVTRLLAGVAVFVAVNAAYNWARFHTPLDAAYLYRPGVLDEPWFRSGLLHPSYIPRHLRVLLLELPRLVGHPPYVLPSWTGLALWLTTPAMAIVLTAPFRRETWACWAGVLPVALLNMMHGTWGFAQFGYRFALDYYPFLFLLIARAVANRFRPWHAALIVVSVVVNLWGVLWINAFGWVTF